MSLEEYEKLLAEKRANLNKKPAAKAFKADPKEFEGMKSYSREVRRSAAASTTRCLVSGLHQAGSSVCCLEGTTCWHDARVQQLACTALTSSTAGAGHRQEG